MILRVFFCFSIFVSTIIFAQNERGDIPQEQAILAPFFHGVASGDPLPNAVIIWSRFTPDKEGEMSVPITYTVATDTAFTEVVQQGQTFADALNDFTIKVDVQNLEPNTYYYYVFTAPDGRNSLIGRTKTAPVGPYNHFRAASISCSSLYSGFFNGYARIAERNDLDVIIHTGDYIYDFVDGNGNNRVPDPFPETPKDLQTWRDRHDFYELDEDAIRMRQQHPLVVIWDNHDVDDYDDDPVSYAGSNRAFFEWLPVRLKQDRLVDTLRIFQKLSFGDLVDVYMLDCYSYKDPEVGSNAMNVFEDELDDENRTYLGAEQREWLFNELDTSESVWRIFGSQKLMSPWCLGCFPDISGMVDFPVVSDQGNVFNVRAWDGFPAERKRLFNKLRSLGEPNNLTLSGDAHLAFFSDLTEDPFNLLEYNILTGGNSVGVELLPSSLTRENLDEIIAGEGGGKPGQQFVAAAQALSAASLLGNIHHSYTNFVDHGYALVDITPERIVGEFWVSEKIGITSEENMARSQTCTSGSGRWSRIPNFSPSLGKDFQAIPAPALPPNSGTVAVSERPNSPVVSVYPNPSATEIGIEWGGDVQNIRVELLDIRSVVLQTEDFTSGQALRFKYATTYPSGTYFLRLNAGKHQVIQKIQIQRQ